MAALIGASATFATALFQLLANARRQAAERAAGKPASRKSGTWLAIFGLMLAAAVAGYAFSEYQSFRDRDDEKRLRQEMQMSLRDIGNAAVRLERAGLQRSDQSDMEAMLAAERRRGMDGVAAVVDLPACAGSQSGAEASSACTEARAVNVAVCAIIPLTASVTEVQLFTRAADASQPWAEARVQPGQDAGSAKFIDTFYERAQGDAKEVCHRFMHWNSQKPRLARILVKFSI